jgi:hypothetical protein
MLVHLAICPDCRFIVSLSLPPVNESPGLQPEPARKPWFSGWNLVWPAAAALAGLALLVIHVRHVATTRSGTTVPTQMAASHPLAQLPAPTTSTSPVSVAASSLRSELRSRSSHPAAAIGAHIANSQKAEAVIDGKNSAVLLTESRNLAELKQRKPAASPLGVVNAQLHGSISGNAVGTTMGSGASSLQAPPGNTLDRLQQNVSGAAPLNPVNQPAPAASIAPPPMTFRQSKVAAAPPAPAAADAATLPATNQTVVVSAGAASIATLSSMSNEPVNPAASILAQHPLPSRLPALSVVSTAHEILAIDTQNMLFFSDDNGTHWKAIPSKWQGRAVKVDLASSVTSSIHGASNFAAFRGLASSQSQLANATLTGTVMDPTGSVIPNASVVISDGKTPNIHNVKTDRTGHYLAADLLPGNYKVEAQAPGFNSQQLAVTVAASQQTTANLILPIGQAAETVTVDASAEPLATLSVAKKTPEPQSAILPIFEITTDTGDHWTSTDGQSWKRK